jgi:glycosyltransferase involved in cell wall biosynthesis
VPDGVLSYWAHPDGDAGLRAAQHIGVPHAVIVGGSDVLLLPRDRRRRECVRRVLTESDAVITVSDGLRDAVLQLGAADERVHTIYQGIDTDLFSPGDRSEARRRLELPHDRNVLVWVGRMAPVKGLEVLIAACAELKRRERSFLLCLIGDGSERQGLESQVRLLNLSDSVRCIGSLSPSSLADWYRAADVTVLSSWSEGLPNVLRESLACGTPFVATDVGSIREIAAPEYSEMAPAGDARALAESVERVLDGSHCAAARHYQPRRWSECAADVAELFAGSATKSQRNAHRIQEAVCG